jgi:hypothetical protein
MVTLTADIVTIAINIVNKRSLIYVVVIFPIPINRAVCTNYIIKRIRTVYTVSLPAGQLTSIHFYFAKRQEEADKMKNESAMGAYPK